MRFKYITEFFNQNGFDASYIISDYSHYEKKHKEQSYPNVIHIHVPEYKKNMSVSRLLSHHAFANEVYKKLNEMNPDVVYCMFPPNMLVKRCAQYKKKHPNVKLVFDCYDSWPESMPVKSPLLKLPFYFWRRLRDKYLEVADKTIAVSEEGKQWLSKTHPNLDISVLYPRLEERPEIFYCSDVTDSIKFCYLGNINYITDIELMISLLGEIAKEKKVIVHHIGGGQNLSVLIGRLEDVGVELISYGPIFDIEKKEKIFSLCNMGLNLPRKEIKSSMSLKSIEYMRAGLPFINSGIGDNWNIVEKEGIGLNCTDDVKSVAQTIICLRKDDLFEMHKAVVSTYKELYLYQDYNSIFIDVIKIGVEG